MNAYVAYFLFFTEKCLDKSELHELSKVAIDFVFADDGVKAALRAIFSAVGESSLIF